MERLLPYLFLLIPIAVITAILCIDLQMTDLYRNIDTLSDMIKEVSK